MMGGVVRMKAVKREGLREIETVGEAESIPWQGVSVRKNQMLATAKRPVRADSVVKKKPEGRGRSIYTTWTTRIRASVSKRSNFVTRAKEEAAHEFTKEVEKGQSLK